MEGFCETQSMSCMKADSETGNFPPLSVTYSNKEQGAEEREREGTTDIPARTQVGPRATPRQSSRERQVLPQVFSVAPSPPLSSPPPPPSLSLPSPPLLHMWLRSVYGRDATVQWNSKNPTTILPLNSVWIYLNDGNDESSTNRRCETNIRSPARHAMHKRPFGRRSSCHAMGRRRC